MSLSYANLILKAKPEKPKMMTISDMFKQSPQEFIKEEKETEVLIVREEIKPQTDDLETHIRVKDGELERLFPKRSSYMMDLALGSK